MIERNPYGEDKRRLLLLLSPDLLREYTCVSTATSLYDYGIRGWYFWKNHQLRRGMVYRKHYLND